MSLALVGDIGGTNARFALWRDERLESVRVSATADYPTLELAIRAYLDALGLAPGAVDTVCLACAGPVDGDLLRFTNNQWRISRTAFCAELQVRELLLINDFSAMALGMTRLQEGERISVCPGTPQADRPCVVIGAGTGLGVGTLLALPGGGWHALPGEGGHVDLPIGSQREAQIWQALQRQIGHVSAEGGALSGNGLLALYRAVCAVDGQAPLLHSAAQITRAALEGETLAAGVLEQFCCLLGRVAGNNVLTLGARGGVYIAGGMVPRFAEFFLASGFSRSLRDKGCMSDYFDGVPVWLVTAEYPGLVGAGVAVQQALAGR
ncbi:glucokinase [Phytopseudomonas dryadis]|uniref:Glucokinase n=1 Tax=Phytopseudomonas dryadis TaxID=2487520 RepID=A0A4Q9QWY9_9GAMM|nr:MULTISPECIES: glucokinase [Pseudomonas]TBU89008.1 glucokinase [Pseudomonas dryadis]TBV08322.1 glucokinase [Pseudomonas dryadis]TBV19675.1 glucokinase [Pseudomonas sp. FRB 230]